MLRARIDRIAGSSASPTDLLVRPVASANGPFLPVDGRIKLRTLSDEMLAQKEASAVSPQGLLGVAMWSDAAIVRGPPRVSERLADRVPAAISRARAEI
jgi:hypothetical protein